MHITEEDAKHVGDILGVDFNVVSLDTWIYALHVELEHGTENKLTDVSGDDLVTTGKIALAHIMEFPDYYQRLKVMEEEGDKYWEGKDKGNVVLVGEGERDSFMLELAIIIAITGNP